MSDVKRRLEQLERDVVSTGGRATHVVVHPDTLAKYPEIAIALPLVLVVSPRCPLEQVFVMDHDPYAIAATEE